MLCVDARPELTAGRGPSPEAGPEVAERRARHSEVATWYSQFGEVEPQSDRGGGAGRQCDAEVPGVG